MLEKLSGGTYLVSPSEANIHTDHIHAALDSKKILSHKIESQHYYKYSDTRKNLQIYGKKSLIRPTNFLVAGSPNNLSILIAEGDYNSTTI
ncbi:hypothetical protein [Vreelandella titanicae]|uniref:hypothetical protein n=1 Tax=Vreelandella titanicae TaxID=664683 RepID=UPI003FD70A64